MNKWHLATLSAHLLFCAASLFAGCGAGGIGLHLAHKDYGFIFKMKITKVSNPMQRNQKGPGMSSDSYDLKNMAALSERRCVLPGDTA